MPPKLPVAPRKDLTITITITSKHHPRVEPVTFVAGTRRLTLGEYPFSVRPIYEFDLALDLDHENARKVSAFFSALRGGET